MAASNPLRPLRQLRPSDLRGVARLATLLAKDPYLAKDPEARAYFYQADGSPRAAGTRLTNPALAGVLRTLARDGADAFYRGPIAEAMVALTLADAVLEKFGGDSVGETRRNRDAYLTDVAARGLEIGR